MSDHRLSRALLRGRQYYGRVLRSLQGLPDRFRCMQPVVDTAAKSAGDRPLHVLEIGTWAGASAVSWATALRSLTHGGKVTCVDAWRPYFNLAIEQDPVYAEMNVAAENGDVFRLFLHNVRCAGVEDLIEYRVGASGDVLRKFESSAFDVIYVDGSHALDDVAEDLTHATGLIRPGGILCGDDLELQREEVDAEEHRSALALGRDYVWAESARAHYHPGVTEAVARVLGRVFVWNGFWAVQRTSEGWLPISLEPGALPDHIAEATRESADDELVVSETVGETAGYNLVRLGPRYVAVAKAVGELSLGVDKIGERELDPVLFIGGSVEELRARVAGHEPAPFDVEQVGETAGYNLVRLGPRYVAVAKAVGELSLGVDKIGERELDPLLLIGDSVEELRARVAGHEPAPIDVEQVGETAGYNLVRLGPRYVAVAKAVGELSLGVDKIGERELDPVLFIGGSVEELRARVAGHEPAPIDVERVGEIAGYNLVRLGSRYVAVAKAVGELSLGVDKIGERELDPVLFIGDSVEELRTRVAGHEPAPIDVERVGETAGYSLVRLGPRYVAVAKAVGELSLGVDKIGERELDPVLFIGDSVEELRTRVAGYEPPQLDVALIDHTATHNLVRFGSRYLAVDRALGPVALGDERIGERELAPYILIGQSLEELRTRLAAGETRQTPELREPNAC